MDPVPVSPENLRRDEVAATPGARDEDEEDQAEIAGDEDVLVVAAAEKGDPADPVDHSDHSEPEAAPASPTRRGRRRVTSGGIITPGAAEAE